MINKADETYKAAQVDKAGKADKANETDKADKWDKAVIFPPFWKTSTALAFHTKW